MCIYRYKIEESEGVICLTFSLTTASSTLARLSRGASNTLACSGPPTNSTKTPSSSDNARRTSSSSSTDSVYYQCDYREYSIQQQKQTPNPGIMPRKNANVRDDGDGGDIMVIIV